MSVAIRALKRTDFVDWYRANRKRSSMLFDMLSADAYDSRPIPLRHPVRFYEGHLPAFSYITLVRGALGAPAMDDAMEKLFQRGIDPASATAAQSSAPAAWPARERVQELARRWDAEVLAALSRAQAESGALSPRVREAVYTVLEHEQMHHETLLYMLHRVPLDHKHRPAGTGGTPADGPLPKAQRIHVPAGVATLGANPEDVDFGWDNEFRATQVEVAAFDVDAHSVTNADYLKFVESGGEPPLFWIRRDDRWQQLAMFEEIALPAAWPVYVSLEQAKAYAQWRGARLLSEPEFQRAAFGAPDGAERSYPWGEEPFSPKRGNLDFQYWDPVPAGSYPAGVSAWGIHDLVGNGWEWTSTPFGPLPGFEPMVSYPVYSNDFFDGDHFVVKGGSAVTARDLVRRSLRNWYRPSYPYIYAKFRLVSN